MLPAMLPAIDALRASAGYLRRHPTNLLYAARQAAGLRTVIPLDALRWFLGRLGGKRMPKDMALGVRPPCLTFGARLELMGNSLRLEAAIRVEEVKLGRDELRVALRLSDFQIEALDSKSPAAQLLAHVDRTKPANLLGFLPKKPPAVVEAKDDLVVLDLMRVPKLAENEPLRRLVSVVGPVLEVREVRTEQDHLLISWRPRILGVKDAVTALRG